MPTSIFSACSHLGCGELAVSFSSNCWKHTSHSYYLENLPHHIKSLEDKHAPINLKKVVAQDLDLSNCDLRNSSFSQVHLTRAHFIGSNLSNSDMIGAKFIECDFVGSQLRRVNMTRAIFLDVSFSHADIRNAYLSEARFDNTDFMGALLCNSVLWNTELTGAKHLKKKSFKNLKSFPKGRRVFLSESNALVACESYRNIRHYFYKQGLHEDASWAAYRELTMERKHFFEKKDPKYIPSLLMDVLSGYTEKPNRVILSSLVLILLFGLLYYLLNVPMATNQAGISGRTSFWDNLYFSFITFTTVGYGDFVPRPFAAFRILVCAEAFSGPFMAGLYIFTLTRRYAAG